MYPRIHTQAHVVAGAILEQDGRILLVKEGSQKMGAFGKWNQPAGWIDLGEDPLISVVREVKEETGLDFEPTGIIGIYSLARKDLAGYVSAGFPHGVKFIFRGIITGGIVKADGEEIIEQRWFTPEEVEALGLDELRDPDIKQEVRDYFAGASFSLDIIHHMVIGE